MTTNPYLSFNGNCEEAFKFYESVLGGKIVALFKPEGTPMEKECGAKFAGKIMHARMHVGSSVLMGSDCFDDSYTAPKGITVNIAVETVEEAERVYAALAKGGTEVMPIAETFWAQRFGMCIDRFGIPWMVNCEKPMAQP